MNALAKRLLWIAMCYLPFTSSGCRQSGTAVKGGSTGDALYQNLSFEMPKVQQPVFPACEISAEKFGAEGDGLFLGIKTINDAIKDTSQHEGDKAIILEGIWSAGPAELLSNMDLYIGQSALVLFTGDFEAYPIVAASFEGLRTYRCQSPTSTHDTENITITGRDTPDGNSDCWCLVEKGKLIASRWEELVRSGGALDEKQEVRYPTAGSLKNAMARKNLNIPEGINTDEEWAEIYLWLCPVLLSIVRSREVPLEGIAFENSPSRYLHPLSCEGFIVNSTMVINPWYSQNGGAIGLEFCRDALIINSVFDAGDDAVCIESDKNEDGRRRDEPCQGVIMRSNTILHEHSGFVAKSEMSGGMRNIYVEDCMLTGTGVSLCFRSTREHGGVVESIYINNINVIDIPSEPLLFDLFYGGGGADEESEEGLLNHMKTSIPPVTEETPALRNVHISNIVCRGSGCVMFFGGLPEIPINNVTVRDVVITEVTGGIAISQVDEVALKNVYVESSKDNNILNIKNAKDLTVDGRIYEELGAKEEILSPK